MRHGGQAADVPRPDRRLSQESPRTHDIRTGSRPGRFDCTCRTGGCGLWRLHGIVHERARLWTLQRCVQRASRRSAQPVTERTIEIARLTGPEDRIAHRRPKAGKSRQPIPEVLRGVDSSTLDGKPEAKFHYVLKMRDTLGVAVYPAGDRSSGTFAVGYALLSDGERGWSWCIGISDDCRVLSKDFNCGFAPE